METPWIHPNTITGYAATESRYFRRSYINEQFWREVQKGNHILFVAPRRVGKTSIMKDLAVNCPEGFVCIYEDIEGVKSREEFYRRIFELILHCVDRSKLKTAKDFLKNCFSKYGISEISKSGIKFESRKIDYEAELRDLIPELKDAKVHAVIFLDEFAEVIHKLRKNGSEEDAVDILHRLREIRSDKDFKHFTIVYAGSIGLGTVIKKIDRPKLINDLHPISLPALTGEEASQLIGQLIVGSSIVFDNEVVEYLKKRLGYLLPYYIQLLVEAIDEIAFKNATPKITTGTVDEAFQRVLKERKNFEDWLERLKGYHSEHFTFINEILKHAAHKGNIAVQEIYNMAKQFERKDDYMDFVDELVHDGYLVESAPPLTYRFVSPLLQQFWLMKYPIYDN